MKYEEELVGQGERAEVILAIGRSQSIKEKRQKQPCLEPDEDPRVQAASHLFVKLHVYKVPEFPALMQISSWACPLII